MADIYQIIKFRAPRMAKKGSIRTLDSPQLISHKIRMTIKSCNFHTVFLEYSMQISAFLLLTYILREIKFGGFITLENLTELVSRKISETEKFLIFHTVSLVLVFGCKQLYPYYK